MVALKANSSVAGTVSMSSRKLKLPLNPGMLLRLTVPLAKPVTPPDDTTKSPLAAVIETTPPRLAVTPENDSSMSVSCRKVNVPLRLWPAMISGLLDASVTLSSKTSVTPVVSMSRVNRNVPERPGMLDRLTVPVASPSMPAAVTSKLPLTAEIETNPPRLADTPEKFRLTSGPVLLKVKVPLTSWLAISMGAVGRMVALNVKTSVAGTVLMSRRKEKEPSRPGMSARSMVPLAKPVIPPPTPEVTVNEPSASLIVTTPPKLASTLSKPN
jgi:hypothetical protein